MNEEIFYRGETVYYKEIPNDRYNWDPVIKPYRVDEIIDVAGTRISIISKDQYEHRLVVYPSEIRRSPKDFK